MIFYLIQGLDLKVIKCVGRAKFVNECLFSDQCVYRLLFGFVRSCLLFNLLVNVFSRSREISAKINVHRPPPPDSRGNIVIMNLLFCKPELE